MALELEEGEARGGVEELWERVAARRGNRGRDGLEVEGDCWHFGGGVEEDALSYRTGKPREK